MTEKLEPVRKYTTSEGIELRVPEDGEDPYCPDVLLKTTMQMISSPKGREMVKDELLRIVAEHMSPVQQVLLLDRFLRDKSLDIDIEGLAQYFCC